MWSRIFRCALRMLLLPLSSALAAPPQFATVTPLTPGKSLTFPRDFGAHPAFRTEWWYATGWLQTPDRRQIGFQITFFRSATGHGAGNPSSFAPAQLIIAHAALSDPAEKKLLRGEKTARQGFGLAQAGKDTTDVRLDDWQIKRAADGRYQASVRTRDFDLQLVLQPTQPVMLQGEQGYSRKGPLPEQGSYYYSEPQLRASGTLTRRGQALAVAGSAWLDHEWSSNVLTKDAAGWDWLGANLDDGSALMAFRIRSTSGATLWSHAALRNRSGQLTQFAPDQVSFAPQRLWQSPRSKARYPVTMTIRTAAQQWQLTPLQDDQELDARRSTGAVYWEGAVSITRDGAPAGHGYLELTGYDKQLKL